MAESTSLESKPKRHWLTGKRLIGLALAALVILRVGVELIPTRVVIGPETTVLDGPVRADGTIDYAAAINEEWGNGVTSDQNAAVALLRALGPGIVSEDVRDAYYEKLGIPVPPLEGDYLINFREFLTAQGIDWQKDAERIENLEQQHSETMGHPWTAEDFPEVAAWLDANQRPLVAIVDACQRPRYFSPLVPPGDSILINSLMPTEQASRVAARLLMAQAMLELGRGNVDKAFDLTLACHRLARHVSEHPTLIGSLIAIALDSMAAEGDAAIVLHGQLTAEQAAGYRQRLQELPPARSLADVFDKGERLIALDSTLGLSCGRVNDFDVPATLMRLGFDPNPTLRRFNHFYDEALAALKLSDPAERTKAFDDIDRAISKQSEQHLGRWLQLLVYSKGAISDQIGAVLVGLLRPAVEQAANAEDRHKIRLQFCDLGYALAEYRALHGTFPDALPDLVPDQLDAVPLDLHTGDPLKYQLTDGGFLLYSLGQNGTDDGGIMDRDKDDIAFGDVPEIEPKE